MAEIPIHKSMLHSVSEAQLFYPSDAKRDILHCIARSKSSAGIRKTGLIGYLCGWYLNGSHQTVAEDNSNSLTDDKIRADDESLKTKNINGVYIIATIVPLDQVQSKFDNHGVLKCLRGDSDISLEKNSTISGLSRCPKILGECRLKYTSNEDTDSEYDSTDSEDDALLFEQDRSHFYSWLTVDIDKSTYLPRTRGACISFSESSDSRYLPLKTVTIIYARPDTRYFRFYSLKPINIDFTHDQSAPRIKQLPSISGKRYGALKRKIDLHCSGFGDVTRVFSNPQTQFPPSSLSSSDRPSYLHIQPEYFPINQLNLSEILTLLNATYVITSLFHPCAFSFPSFVLSCLKFLAFPVLHLFQTTHIHRLAESVLQSMVWIGSKCADLVQLLGDVKVGAPALSGRNEGGKTVKWKIRELSVSVNHLHERLSQMFYSWPAQVSCLMQSSPELDQSDENTPRSRNDNDSELFTEQLKNRATQYINFYNSMWLVLNDVIIGIAIGSILYDNAQEISEWVNWTIEYYTVTHIKSMINWLMSWPAGLKLNNNLVTFLGDLFLWLIYLWNFLLTPILASTFSLLRIISLTGYFGSTFIISLLIDLLSIGVIHITWFYIIAKRLTFWMWKAGRGLGLLFQGKKYNTLRDRYDSADYDLDQLLVGTILFTLLIFLAPTMVCYFLVFWSIRVPIMILHKFCTFLIQYLNTFPLFSVMLRIKDPDRVVGGVEFELAYSKSSSQKEAYLRMKNTPPSIISILTRNPKI